ncbi:hypothetical protein Sjap_007436 [Stephania japonica]|uniref:soluble epoxide hydrolase n=1 Tax=Stephania japonica TaxID=461633 RepID=A0AAP0JMQ9_9MAGN
MEGIEHRTVGVNGINMHIAEKGQGPVVLLVHGFPELWYSWRHQIQTLSSLGYRAVAPDLRGYGDTDAPTSVHDYTCFHLVGDLIGLIDSLGLDKVFVVGHDWGAIVSWYLCLFRPDRVRALVNLSVPFMRRHPSVKFVDGYRARFGDDYYICRFQEPGVEVEFARADTAEVIKKTLTSRHPGPICVPKEIGFGSSLSHPISLPSWLSEEDVKYYASKFDQKGFTGPLNYYRALDINWELTAPWHGAQVKVPVKFITGDLDLVYTTPGVKEFIHSDAFKENVPLLQEIVVIEGAAHFINQEQADEISNHIYDFIQRFK